MSFSIKKTINNLIKKKYCNHKYEFNFSNILRERPKWAKLEIAKCKKCDKIIKD